MPNITLAPAPAQMVYTYGTPGFSQVFSVATGDKLYINGVQYEWREEPAITFQKTLSSPWQATFAIRWFGGTKPAPGSELAFFWNSLKRFGGTILTTTEVGIPGNFSESILIVSCGGFQSYLDRTIVAKLYTLSLGGVPPIIIFDVWIEHLQQFGISLNYPQGQVVQIAEQLYHYITTSEVFNRLKAQQPGYDYLIDDNKALIWFNSASGTGSAPFTLRNSDNNVDTMSVSVDNRKFRNSQWVLPAVDLIALRTESSVATAGQTNFGTLYSINITPIVLVDLVSEAVTTLGVWTGAPWYYIPGGIGVFRTPGASALAGGEVIDISYPNPWPIGFNVKDDVSIAAVGLYEAVYQAKDATTEAECLQIAAGLLEIYGTNGAFQEKVVFTYNSKLQALWLTPGMRIDVDRTFPKAFGDYTVEQVSSILEKLTVWRHTVTCRMGLGEVTDEMALQSFRTSGRVWVNVPPILATMELGIDTNLIAGVQPNSYRFRGSGVILSWDARFTTDPPTGAALIIDLLKNGVSIFNPGEEIIIPDGDTTEQHGIRFISDNLAYVDGDVLTMDILQIGSTNPGKNGLVHLNLKPNTALPPAS